MSGFEVVETGPAAPAPVQIPGLPDVLGLVRSSRVGEDPDGELAARWRAGDERAFEQLVGRYEQRVFRLLLCVMGSREEAEEIAQEVFLKLHRQGHRFRSQTPFSTFVYRAAANAVRDRRRRSSRMRDRSAKLRIRDALGLESQARSDSLQAAAGAETNALVHQALDRLSPSLRFAVVLYDLEGLPYPEIAHILGVAGGAIKSRIHRARRALRSELRGRVGLSGEETPS